MAYKTLKIRLKDKHAPLLQQMARSVNLVWNYSNALSHRSIKERGVFLSAYDLQKYTNGSSKLLGVSAKVVQSVVGEYARRRHQHKKSRLSWRSSAGPRRSLGWIPLTCQDFKISGSLAITHGGTVFSAFACGYDLTKYRCRSACFNEDSRGRWYLNVVVEVEVKTSTRCNAIGIDLGLKVTATCSDGHRLEAGRFYRDLQPLLATAQRAGKKARTRALHAKIANRRKDALHKFSRALVERCGVIVVGDVSPQKLAKTNMAKSVLDAGWGQLKTMLSYKCDHAGIVFKVVSEAYTTQTCSCCGAISDNSPKGRAGLGIREWTCSGCGVLHERDVNAARNILALGYERPVEGIPAI